MSASAMLFIIDFDGTVAPHDTVDALLERFADPEWRDVEERWVRGEIDSRQCMEMQLAMVRAARQDVEAFLRHVDIDPSFPAFVRYARTLGEVTIVSDGLDFTVQHAVRPIRPALPVFANQLLFREGSLGLAFPYRDASCKVGSGVCKCAVARSLDNGRGGPVVLVGDGRSDLCIARSADFVFAKSSLLRFCRAENIAHTPFETFADVLSAIREWNATENESFLGRLNAACLNVT